MTDGKTFEKGTFGTILFKGYKTCRHRGTVTTTTNHQGHIGPQRADMTSPPTTHRAHSSRTADKRELTSLQSLRASSYFARFMHAAARFANNMARVGKSSGSTSRASVYIFTAVLYRPSAYASPASYIISRQQAAGRQGCGKVSRSAPRTRQVFADVASDSAKLRSLPGCAVLEYGTSTSSEFPSAPRGQSTPSTPGYPFTDGSNSSL